MSQEKDKKPLKQIINYVFRKTVSCSKLFFYFNLIFQIAYILDYYRSLVNPMIHYIIKYKIDYFFKMNVIYSILLTFQSCLAIFGLMNAKLNYNGIYKEKNIYEFRTISNLGSEE